MIDLNDAKEQHWHERPGAQERKQPKARYVPTVVAHQAVQGREADIVRALGISWRGGHDHIHCPYPTHPDKDPSWRLLDSGNAVCSAGCVVSGGKPHSVFDVAMHLKGLDFEAAKLHVIELIGREDLIVDPNAEKETPKGLTIEEYAAAKGLSVEWLQSIGVRQATKKGAPAVRIPFFRLDDSPPVKKHRMALTGPKGKQFHWPYQTPLFLYGEWYIPNFHHTGYVVLVEGESDCHTFWYHGIPALGIPGAGNWLESRDAPLLADFRTIYLSVEPDRAGEKLLERIAESSIAPRVKVLRFPAGIKDPSGLYLSDRDGFLDAFRALMNAAQPLPATQTTKQTAPDHEADWSTSPWKVVQLFNARYAVVNEQGKALIYEQVRDPILERNVLVRLTFDNLKKLYQNRIVEIATEKGTHKKPAAEYWLSHEKRRQYISGVVFDPTGKAPPGCWNLWSGFAVEPRQGDWSLMRNHILEVICAGNDEHFEYLLNWAALMFQRPERQGEVAVVVRGGKGVGKGIFFNYLRKAWGQHGIYISNPKHLTGNFNAHLRDCVFLFADEAFYANDRQHESVLKGIVTDPVLAVEGKYMNLVNAPNMLHIGMASNSDWVIPASHDERRYFALDASDHQVGQRKYFASIVAQMENGGLAAMIYELLNRDASGQDIRDVPQTEALAEQKLHSLDSIDKWLLAVLERGYVWRSRFGASVYGEWHNFVSTELLNRSYLQWCGDHRVQYPMTRVQLGKRMTELYKPFRPATGDWRVIGEVESLAQHADPVVKKERPPGYDLLSLDEARARFLDMRKIAKDWGGE
jgi:hypothetical protein